MNHSTPADDLLDHVSRLLAEGGRGRPGSMALNSRTDPTIVDATRIAVAGRLKATGLVPREAVLVTRYVVNTTIAGTDRFGGGLLVTIKSLAKGILLGIHDVAGDLPYAAGQIAAGAARKAAELDIDMAAAVERAIAGIAEAGWEIGENVEVLVERAANGSLEEAFSCWAPDALDAAALGAKKENMIL